MDPISAVGLVGSVVGIVDVITKSVSYLSELQSSYKIVDLKVRLLIGQLSTLRAALYQVAELVNSRPDIPSDSKLVKDLCEALCCVEAVIHAVYDRLSHLQRDERQGGLKTLSKVGFVWDEQTINDYLGLLNNQVNALNLFLTALQCRTTVEQTQVVEGSECQSLVRLIRDDTSSLLWLRDSESIGTCQSTETQDLGTVNATFEFDTEIFASRVYRTATRSSMLRALLWDAAPDDQKSFIGGRSKRGVRSLRDFLGEDCHEDPGTPSTEFQRLCAPSTLPKHTIYPLETIKRLSPKTAQSAGSALSVSWQQRVESRLSRRGLPNSRSPDLGAIFESQTAKVVLLGTSESGKSTLIKSLKVGYMGGYNEEERLHYKPTILKNLWEVTKATAEAVVEKGLMVSANFSQHMREDEGFLAACDCLKKSTASDIYGQHVTVLRASKFHLRRDISLVSAIETIWKEENSYEILRTLISTSSADKHFANSSDRILSRHYIPSDEDILYCRTKTTGIYETQLDHGGTVCRFFDLGGTRAERKKWTETFHNVNAVIFTCDVSCYDTVLVQGENRLSEQLLLFESIVNSQWSVNSHIIVLFTKEDTLTPEKLRISPFQSWFPDYDGQPESAEDILDYLVAQFRHKEENGGSSAVFCRSGSLVSSTTRLGEVAMNALPWSRRGAFSE